MAYPTIYAGSSIPSGAEFCPSRVFSFVGLNVNLPLRGSIGIREVDMHFPQPWVLFEASHNVTFWATFKNVFSWAALSSLRIHGNAERTYSGRVTFCVCAGGRWFVLLFFGLSLSGCVLFIGGDVGGGVSKRYLGGGGGAGGPPTLGHFLFRIWARKNLSRARTGYPFKSCMYELTYL